MIDELERMLAAASPRPWTVKQAMLNGAVERIPCGALVVPDVDDDGDAEIYCSNANDAALIAAAVKALTTLLAVAKAARDVSREPLADGLTDQFLNRLDILDQELAALDEVKL